MVAPAGCGQPSITTRVGSPSVCESTTRTVAGSATRAAPSGIDLHRLDLGVEVARRWSLLAAAGARSLHAAKGRVRVDAGRFAIHPDHAGVDAANVLEGARNVAR